MENPTKDSQEKGRYRRTLKATSLIGGASAINILIGMIRTKFVAILLGPTGVGLIDMYNQIISLVGTVTGMGVSQSGVRQIAEAVGVSDDVRTARTVITLRRVSWFAGLLGLLVMVLFSFPLALITFGEEVYALLVAVLGLSILFTCVSNGNISIVNGFRRISDLAKISVIGAASGTMISIPCFYFWGQKGVVPSFVLASLSTLVITWWFVLRVPIKTIDLSWRDSFGEAKKLFSLGLSFMGAGMLTVLSTYLIRVIILRLYSIEDVGFYQAAYGFSGVLAGFVLNAMGADYYPKLTAVADKNTTVRRMVNEQTQISIFLALPGLAAMMVFAPLLIKIFYSPSFNTAVPVLNWCIFGVLGRVFSWPIGILVVAKGKGKLFFLTELFGSGLHVVFVYLFLNIWGLEGGGIAFMATYIFYTSMMLLVMHQLVGASWTGQTFVFTICAIVILGILMINNVTNLQLTARWTINLLALTGVVLLCIKQLADKTGIGLQEVLSRISLK